MRRDAWSDWPLGGGGGGGGRVLVKDDGLVCS